MSRLPKSQRSSARRVDVRVRAAHPHIQTEIHEISPHHHIIFVSEDQLSEAEYKQEFDMRVTPVALRIEFSNSRPVNSELLPAIADADLFLDFEGLIQTGHDFDMALQALFPAAPKLTGSQIREDGVLEFWFETEIPEPLRQQVLDFLDTHIDLRDVEIQIRKGVEEAGATREKQNDGHTLRNRPLLLRGSVPSFAREEEEWWYGKISEVARGTISKEALLSKKFTGASCYIHASMPGIDIRQALLGFDTIYLEPPIEDILDLLETFWDRQQITKEDLLYLIERDRVRIVMSQPEERCDVRLLEAAKERNPEGVLGRRKTAAMVLSDIVDTDRSYLFSKPELAKELQQVIGRLADNANTSKSEVARNLLFPRFARRSWVGAFQDLGTLGIEPYGQGGQFAEAWKRHHADSKLDPSLEAYTFGHDIHMAHALGATFLPHGNGDDYVNSWILPMQLMGDRLNFYRAFNDKYAAVWAQNERLKMENQQGLLPPVPLFKFNRQAPIKDIDAFTSTSTRLKGRSLVGRLSNLPFEARMIEIERLQQELYAFQRTQDHRRERWSWLETCAGFVPGIDTFASGLVLLKKVAEFAKRSPTLDILITEIEQSLTPKQGQNDELVFLDRISRVAWLKD